MAECGFLDHPASVMEKSMTVRRGSLLITVSGGPKDPSPMQLLKIVEASGSLDFWDDEAEDVYTHDDGKDV